MLCPIIIIQSYLVLLVWTLEEMDTWKDEEFEGMLWAFWITNIYHHPYPPELAKCFKAVPLRSSSTEKKPLLFFSIIFIIVT